MEHDKKEIAMSIASISIVYYTWLVCPDLQSLGKPTQQHMFFFLQVIISFFMLSKEKESP